MKAQIQMETKQPSAAEVKDQVARAQKLVREAKRTLARLQEKTRIVIISEPTRRKAG